MNKLTPMLAAGKNYIQRVVRTYNTQGRTALPLTLAFVLFAMAMFVGGRWSSPAPVLMQESIAALQLQLVQQQQALAQLTRDQDYNINSLAIRLAELKASSTRLDALGERLVQLGKLDPQEFDFSRPPPLGGPEIVIGDGYADFPAFDQMVGRLAKVFQAQLTQLDALQLLLLDRNLEEERKPSGWPVSSGWISSGFGERNDPFSGKKAQHNGLDFAGTRGSEILGVATGVVIWAGTKKGFGQTLEIDHGNGYVTRYAHNEALLVKAGDRVTAGQAVAKMGTTGRASSPHVHFEVLYKGKAVNPYKFVKRAR